MRQQASPETPRYALLPALQLRHLRHLSSHQFPQRIRVQLIDIRAKPLDPARKLNQLLINIGLKRRAHRLGLLQHVNALHPEVVQRVAPLQRDLGGVFLPLVLPLGVLARAGVFSRCLDLVVLFADQRLEALELVLLEKLELVGEVGP